MTLLIIASLWPEPTSSAAGWRMMGLIRLFVSQGWRITYACTASESAASFPLETLGIEVKNITLNDSSFDDLLKERSPDIVLYDRFMVEEQFSWRVEQHCPQAMTILESSDLHCLRKVREKAVKSNTAFDEQLLLTDEMSYREIASIQRTDLTLVISSVEMQLLKNTFGVKNTILHYFPFIVDAAERKAQQLTWPAYAEREGFMCIGNFKHEPNWDSVKFLKNDIWPLIRQQLPSAHCYVYGAYPSAKVHQLHQPKEGFYIKGRAESAKDVMQKARICIAPIRFGAGLKGKLLEAMLYGTPSVTTTIGAEGMREKLPWNGTIVDDANGLAKAAVDLYLDEKDWKKKQLNGMQLLTRYYCSSDYLQPLLQRIYEIKDNLKDHRAANFQGAMLKHHLVKSTKYMSLWIEEKNKRVSDV